MKRIRDDTRMAAKPREPFLPPRGGGGARSVTEGGLRSVSPHVAPVRRHRAPPPSATRPPPPRGGRNGARVAVAFLFLLAPLQATATEPWEEGVLSQPFDSARLGGTLDRATLDDLTARGGDLFAARFTTAEGAGRPMATQAIIPTKRRRAAPAAFQRTGGMDANACAGCHNQPVIGGAGDFAANVFVSEGFRDADFDTLDPQFSNERGTNHLFGAGLIELLAREMTADLRAARDDALLDALTRGEAVTAPLVTKGVSFGAITAHPGGMLDVSGVEGIDPDLTVRPFTHKGVMTGLRQFSVNALNHHHGIQPVERFGARWTGEGDHDGDGMADEMGAADVSALVAWQATLPPPVATEPNDARWAEFAVAGAETFETIGCASCHVPALPLDSVVFHDPGPLDMAGTLRDGEGTASAYDLALTDWLDTLERDDRGRVMVPLYGDLKRHRIADERTTTFGNELLGQRHVARDAFMTTELWGVADTAPYGHRNDLTTLHEAIMGHGADGAASREAYEALDEDGRKGVIAFLRTLGVGR